jgi:DedD protein
MKTKSKQRCVGLLILLAILAIFLPLLFHNAHPSVVTQLSVDIPTKPSRIQTTTSKTVISSQEKAIDLPRSDSLGDVAAPNQSNMMAVMPINLAVKEAHKAVTLAAKPMLGLRQKSSSQPVVIESLANQPAAWVVQLGTFSHEANAKRLIAGLRKKGYDAYFRPLIDVRGHRFLRVFVGPEIRKVSAKQLLKKLSADFHLRGAVRKYQVKL